VRKLMQSAFGLVASGVVALPASAQQLDNPQSLPDAKPGECYAKVAFPAKFTTSTEEVVIQEESERIETVDAVYETIAEAVEIQEEAQTLRVQDATFSRSTQRLEVRPAERVWSTTIGTQTVPASVDTLKHISESGIQLDAAEPGSCYTEYYTDTQYRTETELVLKKEASQRIVVVPAKYDTIQEQVIVKEASTDVVDVPAVYRTETESVLVEPARSVWQSDCGLIEQVDNTTGETLCLVEVPARYETLTKTVLDKPANTKTVTVPAVYKTVNVQKLVAPASETRVDVPAEYETITKRVKESDPVFFWLAKGEAADPSARETGREICLNERAAEYETIVQEMLDTPAEVATVAVPARFESVPVQRLVTAATERRIVIPARTRTVTTRVESEPARTEWRRVLCDINLTRDLVAQLQQALKREGYDPGPIDGIVGRDTINAIQTYQAAEGLSQTGITFEVLQRLKVQS